MKAIVIIDLPENTQIEDLRLDDVVLYHKPNQRGYKLQGKLIPIPERINPLKVDSNNLLDLGYMHGRNDLINQMEGDENE